MRQNKFSLKIAENFLIFQYEYSFLLIQINPLKVTQNLRNKHIIVGLS